MRCHVCRSTMDCQKEDYHYVECGLEGFILAEMDVCRCSCGEEIVSIPAVPELHKLLGKLLIGKKSPLTSKEIRFLRKNMGFNAVKLARIIGVNKSTLSRWESEKSPQKPKSSHDRLIRMIYSNMVGIDIESTKNLIENKFTEIDPNLSGINDPIEIRPLTWVKKPNVCVLPG
jgi:putative zinc finger/helix-turn-helix YgiT family protein